MVCQLKITLTTTAATLLLMFLNDHPTKHTTLQHYPASPALLRLLPLLLLLLLTVCMAPSRASSIWRFMVPLKMYSRPWYSQSAL
jgi:hypothetical protein